MASLWWRMRPSPNLLVSQTNLRTFLLSSHPSSQMLFVLTKSEDMLMTEGLGIEAGREARPANIYPPQHLDVKPNLYACNPHPHAAMHPHHSTHGIPTNLTMSMNKSTGGNGEMDNYFLASMIPNYATQGMTVNVSNGEEGYADFLTTSPPPNLPLGNSSDFLNM